MIVMYTCKDNLTPVLYSGEIKKKKSRNRTTHTKKSKPIRAGALSLLSRAISLTPGAQVSALSRNSVHISWVDG